MTVESIWSEWSEGSVGDCQDKKRTLTRTCLPGQNDVIGFDCPGEKIKEIDCEPNKYFETCNCDEAVGTTHWSCEPGKNLHPDDVCPDKVDDDCSHSCPVWAAWGDWTQYLPSCILEIDDNESVPYRIRERECKFSDGRPAMTNHDSGNCPFSDKIQLERLTTDNCTNSILESGISDDVFAEVQAAVDNRVNDIIDPKTVQISHLVRDCNCSTQETKDYIVMHYEKSDCNANDEVCK